MTKKPCLLIILAVVIVGSVQSPQARAQNDGILIITSTTLIADVVRNVAGDGANVASLMTFSQDPHTYQPSGSDVATLAEADVVFVNGAGFEEGLLPILEEAVDAERLYEISMCVEILPYGFELAHDHDEAEGNHDEELDHDEAMMIEGIEAICAAHEEAIDVMIVDEEHAHSEMETLGPLYAVNCGIGHEDEEAEHEEGGCDPHVWMDVHNVMLWTLFARDMLSAADPANTMTYTANAEAYLAQLLVLEKEIEELVQTVPKENRILVTNHDTYSYFAHAYEFVVVGAVIPSATTSSEPSAGDIAELIEVIQDNEVRAIFTENTVGDDLAQQIANETGASVFKLYTDSLTGPDGEAPDYQSLMRYNTTTIVEGLSR